MNDVQGVAGHFDAPVVARQAPPEMPLLARRRSAAAL
jgi:hypothetical protein